MEQETPEQEIPEEDSYAAFISHASADLPHAEALARHLEAAGKRCWIAPRDLRPGREYGEEIVRGIENSACTVLLLSDAANDSTFVRREIERAVSKGKPVFPLRLSNIAPSPSLELFISTLQWVDAWDGKWDEQAARLIAQLDAKVQPALPARPGGLRSWGARASRILAYSLIGLLFLAVDFLGFNKATERYSEAAFYNVIAPTYGRAPFAAPPLDDGQNPTLWNRHISVILVDDDALGQNDRSGVLDGGIQWPAPMRYHVTLLTDLYDTFHPAAIMVDILFFDRRQRDKEALVDFVRLLERIRAEGRSRLYLAAFDPDRTTTKVLGELADAADVATIAWPETDETNPLYYPLATGAGDNPDATLQGIRAGAAYTIYRDLCSRAADKGWRGLNCPEGGVPDEQFERPMQVFWGTLAPSLNWEQYKQRIFCTGQETFIPLRVWNFLLSGIVDSADSTRQTCPYPQFLKARDFMDPGFRQDPAVQSVLQQAFGPVPGGPPRIVFYGASFQGARDAVSTPTHGRVPGVFQHAMALDNLLTLGDGYIREAEDFDAALLLLNWCMALLVATMAVLARDLQIALIRRGKSTVWAVCIVAASFVAGALVIACAMYVSFVWLRFAPINWLGFFSIMGTIWLVQTRRVENTIEKILHSLVRRTRPSAGG